MLRNLPFIAAIVSFSGCISGAITPATKVESGPDTCPAPIAAILTPMVGDYVLTIKADEGWTGYGSSSISWDANRPCALSERSDAVFNQESETPTSNGSTALIVYDALSETLKTITSDERGYVHIGVSPPEVPFRFQILKPAGTFPTRQIQYREMSARGFDWVWQGRADPSDPWTDRLIIKYRLAS